MIETTPTSSSKNNEGQDLPSTEVRTEPEKVSFDQATHASKMFMSTLNQIEGTLNVDLMANLFDENAELWRQTFTEPYRGMIGARRFWKEYLDQFEHIHSHFVRLSEREKLMLLEWTSEGAVKGGRPIHYTGVSIVELGPDEKICSFRTYFDSAHFLTLHPLPH